MNRTKRSYFSENTKKIDAEGNVVPGDRFLNEDVPTESTFKKLIEGYANILETSDRAKIEEQGLVKIVSDLNAKNNTTPDSDFTYVAQIKNLPEVSAVLQSIDTLINKELISIAVEGGSNNKYKTKLSQDFLQWLSGYLADLSQRISDLSIPDVSGITETISVLSGSVDNLNEAIETINTNASENTEDIQSNASAISVNASAIQGNTEAIEAINVNDGRFLGEIAWRASLTPPNSSWIKADGDVISRTTYSDLFSLIGTTFGTGDGSTTFNVPDLEGKTVRGQSGSFSLGANGGSDSKTLTVANLPEHTHEGTSLSSNSTINLSNTSGTDSTTFSTGNGTVDDTFNVSSSIGGSSEVNVTTNTPIDITTPYLSLVPYIKITN